MGKWVVNNIGSKRNRKALCFLFTLAVSPKRNNKKLKLKKNRTRNLLKVVHILCAWETWA